jgi:ABC-type uncharacterized transport system permease subunit
MTFNLLLGIAVAVLYAYAALRAWRAKANAAVTPLALLLHAFALYRGIVHAEELQIGLTTAFSLLAWQSAALLWIFCWREPLGMLGIVVYPVAAIAALAAAGLSAHGNAIPLSDWTIVVHIALSILSAGLLTLAALQALATAGLDQLLRQPGRMTLARKLPPLQTMERLLFRLIALGFAGLSLTILSGLLFVHDLFGQHLAQKTALTIFAWLIFGTLLWGRFRYGWRGRNAIRWALSGYLILVAAYFGSKLVLEQVMGIHWT